MSGDPGKDGVAGPAVSSSETILHASCVALGGKGLLILGASGSGKSGLALSLMAMGAALVADDRVVLTRSQNRVVASVPRQLAGIIEARGIGLLTADTCGSANVVCVVDLNQCEDSRMPPPRQTELLGQFFPLLFKVDAPHFPPALIQYLKQGRRPE